MSRLQKISLFAAAVFYCLTLYAFLRLDMWLLLVCFIAHSVLILLFSYLCWRQTETPAEEITELEDRIANIKGEWRDEADSLKNQLEDKEKELSEASEKLSEANLHVSNLEAELDTIRIELAEAKEAPVEESDSSILPQFLPDRSESSTVSVIEIAKGVAREFHDDAAKAGLQITVSADDEDLLVKADPKMLRILFRNIVDNSIKYMNRHGMLVITVSSIGDDIFVVCKDTGEGLATEETEHIFELNYQGSNRISGNGLGLYQAKAIVNYYGGTIYAKSTPGKGMGIYIQLPTT